MKAIIVNPAPATHCMVELMVCVCVCVCYIKITPPTHTNHLYYNITFAFQKTLMNLSAGYSVKCLPYKMDDLLVPVLIIEPLIIVAGN